MAYASDEFEDELDENEDPDPEDADWNLDPAVVNCPICGGQISEESEYCPHCRNYVVRDALRRKSPWVIGGVILLAIILAVDWLVRRY